MKLSKIVLLILIGMHFLTVFVQALIIAGVSSVLNIGLDFIQAESFFAILCSFFLILLFLPVIYIVEIFIGSWKRKMKERVLLHNLVFVIQKTIEGVWILTLIGVVVNLTHVQVEPVTHLTLGMLLFIWEEFNKYSKEKVMKKQIIECEGWESNKEK